MHASLTVSLKAICENWWLLDARVAKPGVCGAVVKANAYGLGATRVAQALFEAGCRHFFVATVEEGVELVEACDIFKNNQATLSVFHGVATKEEAEICAAYSLIPVINSPAQWERWASMPMPYLLHVDTGMNRLGFSLSQLQHWVEVFRTKPHRPPEYLMSHLACAEKPEHPLNAAQWNTFAAALALLPEVPASFANSAGIFLGRDYHFSLARPGCALYGINPTLKQNPMQPVVTLRAPVLQWRVTEKAEESVSYGATCRVAKGTRIATVGVGYADGLHRALSNKGEAWLAGQRVPILGIVTMDMIMLDATSIPEEKLNAQLQAEFIGEHITVDEVAAKAGTIGYEVLTRLGNRLRREYVS